MQQRGDARVGGVRMGNDQHRHARARRGFLVEDDSRRARIRELRHVLGIGEKSDRARSRGGQRRHGIHRHGRVTTQLAAESDCKFAERDGVTRERLFSVLPEEEFRRQLRVCAERFTERFQSLVIFVYLRMKQLVLPEAVRQKRERQV